MSDVIAKPEFGTLQAPVVTELSAQSGKFTGEVPCVISSDNSPQAERTKLKNAAKIILCSIDFFRIFFLTEAWSRRNLSTDRLID